MVYVWSDDANRAPVGPQEWVRRRVRGRLGAPIQSRAGEDHPAIRDANPEAIEEFHWGLIPFWADDTEIGNRLVNARAETVAEKPAFRHAFEEQRCLVTVDGFYEWQEQPGGKQPFRVVREDREPFAIAGLWESWEGDGEEIASLTVITTEPNEDVEPIHDRMPVMFEPGEERDWLHADSEEAEAMLKPIAADSIAAYPVSTTVNDPTNDNPSVVEDVAGYDQSGPQDFGSRGGWFQRDSRFEIFAG